VTQKVAYGAACAALGITDSPDLNEMGRPNVHGGKLALGNLDIARMAQQRNLEARALHV
jgi:GDPmannose 4,6-dehydratase